MKLWDTRTWDYTAPVLEAAHGSAEPGSRPQASFVRINSSLAAAAYEDGKLTATLSSHCFPKGFLQMRQLCLAFVRACVLCVFVGERARAALSLSAHTRGCALTLAFMWTGWLAAPGPSGGLGALRPLKPLFHFLLELLLGVAVPGCHQRQACLEQTTRSGLRSPSPLPLLEMQSVKLERDKG